MHERDNIISEKDNEVQILRVQLQALQNYMTTLIVEREQTMIQNSHILQQQLQIPQQPQPSDN